MPIFSSLIFYAVRWSARRGLHGADMQKTLSWPQEKFEKKEKARRTGMRGETYGYWYLRRPGYVFVAKNYMPVGAKGELDPGSLIRLLKPAITIRARPPSSPQLRSAAIAVQLPTKATRPPRARSMSSVEEDVFA
jgi:hypothetical protein